MSRILQALKQLENRPAEPAPADAAAAPAARQPAPTIVMTPPASSKPAVENPPSPPSGQPRRKKKQAARRAERDAAIAGQALQTAADIEQLLAALDAPVIECWSPDLQSGEVVVEDCWNSMSETISPLVIQETHEPLASTTRDELSRAVPREEDNAFPMLVAPSWSPALNVAAAVVIGDASPADGAWSSAVVVNDQTPAVIEVRCARSPNLPPAMEALELAMTHTQVVDAPLGEALIATVVEQERSGRENLYPPASIVCDHIPEVITVEAPQVELAPEPPEATPEIELWFTQPRRRVEKRVKKAKREPKAAKPSPRESQMRTMVRGPSQPATKAPSVWETSIHDNLQQAALAASYAELTGRWRTLHRDEPSPALLVVSLDVPIAAAETVMHAATLLAAEGEAVLVIDADEDAGLSRRLGISGQAGLADLLSPEDAHGDTIHPTATARLHVIPHGKVALAGERKQNVLRRLLGDFSQQYQWILIAGGRPQTPLTQTLARVARGTYVVAPLASDLETARAGLSHLRNAGARVLGAVVSGQ